MIARAKEVERQKLGDILINEEAKKMVRKNKDVVGDGYMKDVNEDVRQAGTRMF